MRLICVTLSDANDWEDHRNCYDKAFAAYRYLAFPETRWTQLPVISGTSETVALGCGLPGVLVHTGAQVETSVELPRFVFAPVEAGAPLGRVTVTENGHPVCTAEISALLSVELDEDGVMPWKRFWKNRTKRSVLTFFDHGGVLS